MNTAPHTDHHDNQPLTEDEKQTLLKIARTAIADGLTHEAHPPETERLSPTLRHEGASFVTLNRGDQLRGCIGALRAYRPLAHDVYHNAQAAAFEDPRFPPVTRDELPELAIEISVLSTPQPLAYENPEELLEKLRPHVDGVVLQHGLRRATFLPQVWEKIARPKDFLENLCHKAGLPPHAWRDPETKIRTYQVTKFEEETPAL
jgi:AmmeMemoRadiSam system protein A